MKASQLRPLVVGLFPETRPRRSRVAIEQELLANGPGATVVPIEAVRAATRHAASSEFLSFEPGGQVELSLPCAANPSELATRLTRELTALRTDCAAAGITLFADPVDDRPAGDVPLQLTSPRYLAMQRHLDTIGPAGRRMMRQTAATQICLDWWPGAAGLEQWRVLNLAAPFLAAAFARSRGPGGRLTTWLAVDPARTGFDDRMLRGDDPIGAYADFAAGATVFTTPGDAQEHLTTLFPPVRPRGSYLEARFLDVQEERDVEGIVAAFAALLYDDDRRQRALRELEPERAALADHWAAAAAGDQATADRGRELVATTTSVERAA
jgi:glutamate--cysteine ligase